MKQRIISVGIISFLLIVIIVMCINIFGGEKDSAVETSVTSATSSTAALTTVPTTIMTTAYVSVPAVSDTTVPVTQSVTTAAVTQPTNNMPDTPQEVIDKYTELVNEFKTGRPAYKKKEYQVLPEEHRKFSDSLNFILDIAANYMVSEDECEELVRAPGAEEILTDMPVHNAQVGCVLTDYDAVSWAKCDDLGDGTYKLSFSLKEEINAEPTPADSLIPVSAHGAVMQPMAIGDLTAQLKDITDKLPGININGFSLCYRDCEFSCIYNPETDKVQSITHHIVIDIEADIELFGTQIVGSARLLNEMLIYDITW